MAREAKMLLQCSPIQMFLQHRCRRAGDDIRCQFTFSLARSFSFAVSTYTVPRTTAFLLSTGQVEFRVVLEAGWTCLQEYTVCFCLYRDNEDDGNYLRTDINTYRTSEIGKER